MEAIKFSELPTGDRMPLADEDGVPIIANQENRLLTWGRLKKQLAAQTHTDEVKPNESKVPTSTAVENRIKATEDDLRDKIDPLATKLGEHDTAIENAQTIANEAKTAATEAKNEAVLANNNTADAVVTANTAKATAESALEEVATAKATANNALEKATEAQSAASSATSAITEATSSISAVSDRVASIETKIENGEIGGAPEAVDLTPITGRLDAVEATADTAKTTADAAKAAAILTEQIIQEMNYERSSATGIEKLVGGCQTAVGTDVKLADVVGVYNSNFQAIQTAVQFLKDSINESKIYPGWSVEITAGSIDEENGLMTGAPSFTETTEETDESLLVAEALALIFRNQEALYQILMDTRKRAIANATNLTAMLTNINAVLSQVMN